MTLEQSNEGSSRGRVTRENAPRGPPRSRWKDSSADFGWPKAIVTKISIDCWCKRANNASNCRGGPPIQIVHIKDTIDALWGCQDKPNCSPRLPFWPPNSPDLNPLDYYVWSVIERVTKSRQCDVIKDRYWGSIRRHGQRYITACFRSRIEVVIQANGEYIE